MTNSILCSCINNGKPCENNAVSAISITGKDLPSNLTACIQKDKCHFDTENNTTIVPLCKIGRYFLNFTLQRLCAYRGNKQECNNIEKLRKEVSRKPKNLALLNNLITNGLITKERCFQMSSTSTIMIPLCSKQERDNLRAYEQNNARLLDWLGDN